MPAYDDDFSHWILPPWFNAKDWAVLMGPFKGAFIKYVYPTSLWVEAVCECIFSAGFKGHTVYKFSTYQYNPKTNSGHPAVSSIVDTHPKIHHVEVWTQETVTHLSCKIATVYNDFRLGEVWAQENVRIATKQPEAIKPLLLVFRFKRFNITVLEEDEDENDQCE